MNECYCDMDADMPDIDCPVHGDTSSHRVHMSHCCLTHGCKYGYPDCPVANEMVTQDYPCESCYDDLNDPIVAAAPNIYPCPCCNGTGKLRDATPEDGMIDV